MKLKFHLPTFTLGKKKGQNANVAKEYQPSPAVQKLTKGIIGLADMLAPSAIEVDFNHLKIDNSYFRTLFIAGYPRFVNANWLHPLIAFDHTLNISMFIYPVESKQILEDLKRKIGEMEATIQSDIKRGRVIEPTVQIGLNDALNLQQQLAKGAERFFQFGLYITIPANDLEELEQTTKQVESTLASLLIITKKASLQMEEGFKTCLPTGQDNLGITRNMDTTSLATTFPFTSSELTANEGILYGINEHNDSLVIFDRFSLENANSVVFAKSGAGKSYLVKLETLRSLLFDSEILVIDPEAEYKTLCDTVGGEYIDFSLQSGVRLNPFDLSGIYEEGVNELGLKILSLHSLMRIIMGNLTPQQDAVLDRALVLTYKQAGITPEPATQRKQPPVMDDFYRVLTQMKEAEAKDLAARIEKFISGSLAGLFTKQSNLDLNNKFTVFSTRDLEDQLRPIAMFIILDYIWTKIKKDLRKRLLVVDEAWYLMRHPDSATFLYSIAKRARKYYLGLTTITQDIEDFLGSDYGRAIVNNSSIQILLKQAPSAIDRVAEVFYLSEGEKQLLLSAEIGQGLFFAGGAHVAIKVVASSEEHRLITSKPEELLAYKKEAEAKKRTESIPPPTAPFPPPTTHYSPPLPGPALPAGRRQADTTQFPPPKTNRPIYVAEPISKDLPLSNESESPPQPTPAIAKTPPTEPPSPPSTPPAQSEPDSF